MSESLNVGIINESNVAVVMFNTASLNNSEEILAISRQIKKFIDDNRPIGVVFDFEGVRFFSSQVLGALLDIRAEIKMYDGEVAISAIEPKLHRVFRITNLDKIFGFFPDRASAVKSVSKI